MSAQTHCPCCGHLLRPLARVVETPLRQDGTSDIHRPESKYRIVECLGSNRHMFKEIGSGLYGMEVKV